jgi:citrate lyase subunit beta/citryl-CoA lyase
MVMTLRGSDQQSLNATSTHPAFFQYTLAPVSIEQEPVSMPTPLRPRRSVLYTPGSNARALEKARTLAADGFIFDLEDGVAPNAKDAAREQVARALAISSYHRREVLLRVNSPTTAWGHADLAAAARMPIDAVLLPKVECARAVRDAEAALVAAGAPDHLGIWCMMETPRGVLHAEEIASVGSRVTGLVMGTSDLAKDLRAQHTRDRSALLMALQHCLLAARAYGLAILDGVHLDFADDAGFLDACRQGRQLGFDGKTLIHPKTIAAANTVFAPSSEDVAWSRRIIAAHGEAVTAGSGVVLVDGKLIENLHVESARELLALAEAIAALEQGEP